VNGISTFLWFDGAAEEAADHYVSIFPNSSITGVSRLGEEAEGLPAPVLMVSFELDGRPFTALNGGPMYAFSPAISFVVNCEGQPEVDEYWERLSAGGSEGQCGWLTDRYGVSWQVVPSALGSFIGGADPAGAARAMQAMLGMRKLVIADLAQAYHGA
jgi:predicted 3-demethylubiquinone-9 3-methyltransferase (glyoxalase superfamily)